MPVCYSNETHFGACTQTDPHDLKVILLSVSHTLSPNRSPTTCGPALPPAALWCPPACCPEAPLPASLPTHILPARLPVPPTTVTWASPTSRTSLATSPSTTSSAQTPSSRRLPTVTTPSRPSLSLRGARPASPCYAWRPRSTRPTSPGPCDQGSCACLESLDNVWKKNVLNFQCMDCPESEIIFEKAVFFHSQHRSNYSFVV